MESWRDPESAGMRETPETAGEEGEEDGKQREKEAKKSNFLSFFGHFFFGQNTECVPIQIEGRQTDGQTKEEGYTKRVTHRSRRRKKSN